MSKHHVLVIGELRELSKLLKEKGARLTLLTIASEIKTAQTSLYDSVFGLPSDAAVSEWVAFARAIHQDSKVTAIGGFRDAHQDKAVMIADALGLSFHSAASIAATRYKDQMRLILNQAGVDSTPNRRVRTKEEIEEFAATHGYPLILKPVDGRASIGVSRIDSAWAIMPAIEWARVSTLHTDLCVEPYLEGEEFSVEAFSEQGEHRVLCMTQKVKEHEHFVEIGHCLPAIVDPATQATVYQLVKQTLTTLGVRNGPTHTEVILTIKGPHIIETHMRAGGDHIPELLKLATSVDILDLWACQVLGAQGLLDLAGASISSPTFAAIWYSFPRAIGTLLQVEGEAEAQTLPGVVQVGVRQATQLKINGLLDSFSRIAHVIATGDSPEQAWNRAQEASSHLQFWVTCP